MRTNIEIDDALMAAAQKASGQQTKKQTVEQALHLMIRLLGMEEIAVGDLMLCEVLQGLDSERAAREVEALLRRFEIVSMAGDAMATTAARNFRSLRRRGITVRKTSTWPLRQKTNFLRHFNAICPVQSLAQKQIPSRLPQISTKTPAVPSPTRGGSRSSRTRDGMRWTRQRRARSVFAGRFFRE